MGVGRKWVNRMVIYMNLEEFILECKARQQLKKQRIHHDEEIYISLHEEACLHASYGKMYKPKSMLFWKQCPVCKSMIDATDYDFKYGVGWIFITVYTCVKCNYRYVQDLGLFGKELEVCKEKE